MKTTNQAAETLGISVKTVRKWCLELGIKKSGRDYMLTAAQIKKIKSRRQLKPGRPFSPESRQQES